MRFHAWLRSFGCEDHSFFQCNPVVDLGATDVRDPKVFWHGESAAWIMAVVLAQRQDPLCERLADQASNGSVASPSSGTDTERRPLKSVRTTIRPLRS